MSISEEIRASAGAHRDLGPGYDTAIAEGLVERIGDEIDRRVDARLYRQIGPPPGTAAPLPATAKQVKSGPGFFTAVMVLGSMAMGIGASAVVLAPPAHVAGSGALVVLIWVAIGAINYFWSRRRLSGHDGAQDAQVAVLPDGPDLGEAGRGERVDVYRELIGLAAAVGGLDPAAVAFGAVSG